MAQKSAMTGGEIAKDGVFSPSVAYGASSLITGPAGPCRAQPGVSPALGAALREPWVRSTSNYNSSLLQPDQQHGDIRRADTGNAACLSD